VKIYFHNLLEHINICFSFLLSYDYMCDIITTNQQTNHQQQQKIRERLDAAKSEMESKTSPDKSAKTNLGGEQETY
jgi:uncharacterized protein (DUF2344 family)